jgi:hypothetical protein
LFVLSCFELFCFVARVVVWLPSLLLHQFQETTFKVLVE